MQKWHKKKLILPSFTSSFLPANAHKTYWSRIKTISDRMISRNVFIIAVPFMSSSKVSIFFYILHPWDVKFFPTSHPVTENEFGHTERPPIVIRHSHLAAEQHRTLSSLLQNQASSFDITSFNCNTCSWPFSERILTFSITWPYSRRQN